MSRSVLPSLFRRTPMGALAVSLLALAASAAPVRAQSSSDPVYVFSTTLGNISVQLYPDIAPKTVANFLGYVSRGDYNGSFIHRSVAGFIFQGGGYQYTATSGPITIPTQAPVVNEFKISNTRGTLAMAKLGSDPNSATDQWFFNEADNSANLDNQNGGFSVFGKVVDAASLAVMDKIAAVPTVNAGSPFDQLPVLHYTSGQGIQGSNLIFVNTIKRLYLATTARLSPGTPGSSGFYAAPVTVTLSASDPGSTVKSTVYSLDGAVDRTYTAPFAVSTDGPHTLTFHSVDMGGGVEADKAVTFKIDRTKPVTAATVTRTTTGEQVTLAATDALSGVASKSYSLDGGPQTSYTVPLLVSRNGSHTLSYHSTDKAGNVETAKTTAFTVAVALPVTSDILAGTLGANDYYKSPITVTLTAEPGALPVAHKFYGVDGAAQAYYSVPFSVPTDGTHVLLFHSADSAGNAGPAKAVSVKIDRTKPVTTATVAKTTTGEQVTLSATDNFSGIASRVYTIDGGAAKTYTAPFTLTVKGRHTVTYNSTDKAGNVETVKTLTVTVA